jgi:hypothetical protein
MTTRALRHGFLRLSGRRTRLPLAATVGVGAALLSVSVAFATYYTVQYVWSGGPYTKSGYVYYTSMCSDYTGAQWWHYMNVEVTGYSSQVYVHSVQGTGGGDIGPNSPLYWGARYVYDFYGNQWTGYAPYPSKRHDADSHELCEQVFQSRLLVSDIRRLLLWKRHREPV